MDKGEGKAKSGPLPFFLSGLIAPEPDHSSHPDAHLPQMQVQ
jgi:hypothetical protein